jgi:Zn-dependent protease with chaperone function
MSATLHLLLTLVISTLLVRPLANARWTWRAPHTGIALWQLLTATWTLCALGTPLAIGLSAYDPDIPTALTQWSSPNQPAAGGTFHLLITTLGVLLAAMLLLAGATRWLGVLRTRRRHRHILALVGRSDPAAPGALVLDHPVPVAYCLPGLRSRVVLSSATLRLLNPDQIAAVLAHEHAHARERHDLVLLPFTTLRRLLPRSRLAHLAAQAVALLVEMRADEHACRQHSPTALAGALHQLGGSPPAGALGADTAVTARLLRIHDRPTPLPITMRWLAVLAGLTLVSTPLTFLLI